MAVNFLRHDISKIYFQLFKANKNVFPCKRDLHLNLSLNKQVSFNLSDIGEGIREVTVKEWYVKEGDSVEQFDNLCEVQSDKASVTITSRYDGKIVKLHANTDEIAFVGKPLLDFDVSDEDAEPYEYSDSNEPKELDPKLPSKFSENTENIARDISLATPAVRRIARENNVNLSHIQPTGKNGRVLKGDVMEYLGMIPRGTNVLHPSIVAKFPKENQTKVQNSQDSVETLKGVRRAMLKSMSESLKIPHFAYCDEIDLSKLVEFRDQLRSTAREEDARITFMPFFIKAASIALLKYPILNSSLDLENESVVHRAAHNISVAIHTNSGLVVPNIKDCQGKNLLEISQDLNDLIERGRADKLTPNDFLGGTFSLSNIGVIGGTYTHPCIMAPQVAIGAMGRINIVPRFNEHDEIVKAYIMNISWCADHRIIDGVTMANFSNLWKKYLESPMLFLLQ